MQKKAQLTIFIILGIVIVIIAVSLIYMATNMGEQDIKDKSGELQKTSSELAPVITYIDSCIETTAKKGLFLLGSQAGNIYISQGGQTRDYRPGYEGGLFLIYQKKNVPYLINLPTGGQNCKTIPPEYPVAEFLDAKGLSIYPYLDDSFTDKKYNYPGCFGSMYPTDTRDMMKDLKSYIETNLPILCDFSVFPNYDISPSTPQVDIQLRSKETQLTLDYPIKITEKNSGYEKTVNEFAAKIPLSLNELSSFVNLIILKDISDPTHDITIGSLDYPDFEVYIDRNFKKPIKYKDDDIIIITSDKLTLDGQEFEFIFTRKDRPPILEYVHDHSIYDIPFNITYKIKWQDIIHQKLRAIDPDEDKPEIKIIMNPGCQTCERELTETRPYIIEYGDIQKNELPIRISASDGTYTDYLEHIVT
jgi:hypothetical protein